MKNTKRKSRRLSSTGFSLWRRRRDSPACGRALADRAGEVGLDMLGGALSGGVMAGGSVAINAYQNGKLVKEGLKAPEGSEIRKAAEQIRAELNAGQKVSQAEYAKLGQLIDADTKVQDRVQEYRRRYRELIEAEQKNSASEAETVSMRTLLNESEEQKTTRLSGAEITVTRAKKGSGNPFNFAKLSRLNATEASRYLKPLLKALGITGRNYSNLALSIEFEYSNAGAQRSISHQAGETRQNYGAFSLVQSNLEAVCENAYPLEAHYDEKPKTADNHVSGVATLGSVLQAGSRQIPVRLTIKFYDNAAPKLHIIINGEGSAPVREGGTQNAHQPTESTPNTMTIADFFKLVNGSEEFTKRIPDSITGKRFDNAESAPYNVGETSRREENYGGEEVYLREGGKRLDRESAGRSVRSLGKETRGAESGYQKTGSRDGEEAHRAAGRQVTPVELGIKNGSRTEAVYVVDTEHNEYLQRLNAQANKR